jgi:hypothetical protein
MENDQNIVYRFSKITTKIKLTLLWVSLIILYCYTNISYSIFAIFKYGHITEKVYHIKSLVVYIPYIREIIFIAIEIIELTPVFIMIANIFIKKNLIDYINIIAGFIYIIIGIIILCYNYAHNNTIICIVQILILFLIIIISIQRLKIKKV